MRVLLDECVPRKLAKQLTGYEVQTQFLWADIWADVMSPQTDAGDFSRVYVLLR